jgi:Transposase
VSNCISSPGSEIEQRLALADDDAELTAHHWQFAPIHWHDVPLNLFGGTLYRWKAKYGGMTVSEARRLKVLEDENRRLKHLVADLTLDNQALKAVVGKKW